MRTVREVLNKKGNLIWSVSPEASVYEALQLMAEKEAGAVLVIENGKIKGILSNGIMPGKWYFTANSQRTPV